MATASSALLLPMKYEHFKVSVVRIGHMLDTDTCKTFARYVSDTQKLYRILKNYKLVCQHRVQCRVGFEKIRRSCVRYLA